MENKIIPVNTGIFFDSETNGIPFWKEPSHLKKQPHMTQLAAIVVDLDRLDIIQSMNMVVLPESWVIPPECVELNGITTEYARAVGIPEINVLDTFLDLWRKCSIRFAFNTTFDNRIIRIATKRYYMSDERIVEDWHEGKYECQMIRAKKHLGLKKNPKLVDAYKELTGGVLEDAHNAMADVMATFEIYKIMEDADPQNDPVENLFS